ncbi:NAD-dependent epimerase/dehydratase family protein [Kitasatospora sp. MBT63]|uniref:NAD-dependent epimerase/dehydratase family protein n=1 Tax=Kitasatospora sp. MBT63 TaxID=1444768 RepID=UPI000539B001|nr:NAD-dependent epimerase/dehydratase family protein [Kitasatospora sp. MBT63]
MKILVLGGSKFLGRAYVVDALARGHQVTTFNRGVSGADLDHVEAVRGDRTRPEDLERLVDGRRWDAVVDTSGQQPYDVAQTARLLRGRAGHYSFVSSVHAFADWPARPVDESSRTLDCPADTPQDQPFATALKAGCERALLEQFGEHSSVLNCGLLYGPHEPIGRLPWWLERIARGGRVLAPGDPARPMQLIDARDFAAFGLDLIDQGLTGRFVTTAPIGRTTYGDFLDACVRATGSDAELVWTDDATLLAAQVEPWSELPLWAPDTPDWQGAWRADSAKAVAAGLRCRPVAETARDTWAWLRNGGSAKVTYTQGLTGVPIGIEAEKEQRILAG